MRTNRRQGVALVSTAAAVAASALLMAPPAWAAPPSMDVYLSSVGPKPVSGSALVVLTGVSASRMFVDIYFLAPNYEPFRPRPFLFDESPCSGTTATTYGFSLTVDGSPANIARCSFDEVGGKYELFVEADRPGTSACLVWNANLIKLTAREPGPVEPNVPETPYTLPVVTPMVSSSACSASVDASVDAQIPVAPLQQFSVPAGTTAEECAALAPASVDWPGVASLRARGWSVSYGQWPNGGTGGWVCSRQPYWNGSSWSS